MKTTRDQHEHILLDNTGNIQSIRLRGKNATFRQLYVYGAKDYVVGGVLTPNDNDLYVGLDGDGPKVATDVISALDLTPKKFVVPDPLPEMKIEDVWIKGTFGDGVWISYVTDHPA